MNKKKGFTLIEVICAVAILSIVMVMFSTLLNNSLNLNGSSSSIDASSSVAQSNIENNNGNNVDTLEVKFNFGDGVIIGGTGNIKNSKDENVNYSVLVSEDKNFNDSGWGSGEVVESSNGNNNVTTPTPDTTTIPISNVTVSFKYSYNNHIFNTQTVPKGSVITYPEIVTIDGYTYISGKAGVSFVADSDTVITYVYMKNPKVTLRIYLPYNNGGDYYYDSTKEITIIYDTSLSESNLPTKDGYFFNYIKDNRGDSLELPIENVTSDLTLYAFYSKSYTITFNYGSGLNTTKSIIINKGSKITYPTGVYTDISNTDSSLGTFDYWKVDNSTDNTKYYKNEIEDIKASKNMSFFAIYKANSNSVDIEIIEQKDKACKYFNKLSNSSSDLYYYYNNSGEYSDSTNKAYDYVIIDKNNLLSYYYKKQFYTWYTVSDSVSASIKENKIDCSN